MTKRNRMALVAAGLALALPALADDAATKQRIEARLSKARVLEQADVAVEVEGGHATLSGVAPTLAVQRRAEKEARKETRSVENRIRVMPEARPDAEIRAAAVDAILRHPQLTVFDSVELGVEDGVVVLQGSVRHPWRKGELEELVARVAGVREIHDELRVQPVSLFDDALRYRLVRAIYGDERFVQYAIQANPPIRIVVENGRVTLTGYVASAVEQALLGHIARASSAFAVENRVKVDGQADAERPKTTS